MEKILFHSFSSSFTPSFWEELYNIKLNVQKLDSSEISIRADIRCSDGEHNESLLLDSCNNNKGLYEGKLLNVNTPEEFKIINKKELLADKALHVLSSIVSREAIEDPAKLLTFLLLTYADLKTYRFSYWLACPALIPSSDSSFYASCISSNLLKQADEALLVNLYKFLSNKAIAARDSGESSTLDPVFIISKDSSSDACKVISLAEGWHRLMIDSNIAIVVADSSAGGGASAGYCWIVRNLLVALSLHLTSSSLPEPPVTSHDTSSLKTIRLIGLRGSTASKLYSDLLGVAPMTPSQLREVCESSARIIETDCSVVTEVNIQSESIALLRSEVEQAVGMPIKDMNVAGKDGYLLKLKNAYEEGRLSSLKTVGWEANERGKPGPRVADLSQTLDSRFLMRQAVDLNLRLMKWRVWPELNTNQLANTKCLLLGAGTLGCAVARSLLGWGVRTITLVDSGRVSYSNPARQCLFEFADCENRRFKAEAAAERLRSIFPDVNSEGVVLSIPMPGHPLLNTTASAEGSDEAAYHRLEELVQSHDACFVLTDSREARWLPTVLCAAHNKLLLNAALGFDSYLVMRHGLPKTPKKPDSRGNLSISDVDSEQLGCYFCNDVVAATNSQRDRSMDQQCTVTRPGLSFIAAAQCVELLVALLHFQSHESAQSECLDDAEASIPHQIRGSLHGFSQMVLKTPAFSCCTACSVPVVEEYRKRRFEFLKEVCADSSILETISGVDKLNDMVDLDMCVDSDEEF